MEYSNTPSFAKLAQMIKNMLGTYEENNLIAGLNHKINGFIEKIENSQYMSNFLKDYKPEIVSIVVSKTKGKYGYSEIHTEFITTAILNFLIETLASGLTPTEYFLDTSYYPVEARMILQSFIYEFKLISSTFSLVDSGLSNDMLNEMYSIINRFIVDLI